MTAQDYVSAFYRKYWDLPDALKAYKAEKAPSNSVSAYRAYAADKLLAADANPTRESEHDPELLLPVVLNRLRRSMPVSGGRTSSKGVVAREIEEILEDLVAMYRTPRSFFKEGGRWAAHFGGEILIANLRGRRGRAAGILERIARRWGRAPFEFNKDLKNHFVSAPPRWREAVDRLIREFEASRGGYSDGRRKGSRDSRPRLATVRVAARNLEVDAETLATKGGDLDRDGAGNQAEAIRRVAARRGEKPDSVKKGVVRSRTRLIGDLFKPVSEK